MSTSPFETLPEEVIMAIAAHLGTWHAAHRALMCTTRAARFGTGHRGHGVRSVFLRYFSAYISVLERYEECLLDRILSDVVRYAIPPPGRHANKDCRYAAGHFAITYADWTDVFDRLRTLYRLHCQRIIGPDRVPHMQSSTYFDCLYAVRQFRHMYENGAITMFQLCFGLHRIIFGCADEARWALDNAEFNSPHVDNVCAADAALASWIEATPILKEEMQKFNGLFNLSTETALSLVRTRTALNLDIFHDDDNLIRYASQIANLQGRRPGCATCYYAGRPCVVV